MQREKYNNKESFMNNKKVNNHDWKKSFKTKPSQGNVENSNQNYNGDYYNKNSIVCIGTDNDNGGTTTVEKGKERVNGHTFKFGDDCDMFSQISKRESKMENNNTIFSEIRMDELNFTLNEKNCAEKTSSNNKELFELNKKNNKKVSNNTVMSKKEKFEMPHDGESNINQESNDTNDMNFEKLSIKNSGFCFTEKKNKDSNKRIKNTSSSFETYGKSFEGFAQKSRTKLRNNQNNSRTILYIEKIMTEFSDKIIEIKNHQTYSNFELSKMFFEIFHEAPPQSIIILPPRYISLPHLIINHSITIRGCPGTLLELTNGPVIIRSQEVLENNNNINNNVKTKAIIAECSFVFNIESKTFEEKFRRDGVLRECAELIDKKYKVSLFKIMNGNDVEISDCDFRIILHVDEEIIDEENHSEFINESLFDIRNHNDFYFSSSICSGFYRVINSTNLSNSKIVIEKCFFEEIIDSTINLKNANKVDILGCIINNSTTGIKISYDSQVPESSIIIKDNEISQNRLYGIYLQSNTSIENTNSIAPNLGSIEIINNKLIQNKFTSLFIQKVNVGQIKIMNNEISFNFDIGIMINEVIFITEMNKSSNSINLKENLNITSNIFNENKNNFALKLINLKNVSMLLDSCEIKNNLYGPMIANIYPLSLKRNKEEHENKEEKCLIVLQKCTIKENLDVGIIFTNIYNTQIKISNCIFSKNNLHGLYFNNNEISSEEDEMTNNGVVRVNSISKTRRESPNLPNLDHTYPRVYLQNCEISNNKSSGVYLKNHYLNFDLCKIIENNKWAIEIPLEKNKSLIELSNYNKDKLGVMITNPIGGAWGVLSNKKTGSACSKNKGTCIIY